MNNLTESVQGVLGPATTTALGNAIIGLVILVIGLMVVKFLSNVACKLLGKIKFLSKYNLLDISCSLIRGILTIFVLMAVLQHFGLTDVLSPLKNMIDQFLSAVPRIIGAGVVAYAGWIIAKIVAELVAVPLKKVDQQIAEKTGSDKVVVSKFGSAFIFVVVLVPIIVAALGILNIPAISVPASDMLNKLMAAIPNIIGAGIILLVTYVVTKFVVYLLTSLLDGMHLNDLPVKLGLTNLFTEKFTPIKLIGGAIMFFSMLAASTAALNTLGIEVLAAIFAKILTFGGGLLVGAIILIVGNFLSSLAYQTLSKNSNIVLANIARFAILGLVLAMGLQAMGLADDIITMAFGFTLGGVAIATALAFGLGGRDAAKKLTDLWADKITKKKDLTVDNITKE